MSPPCPAAYPERLRATAPEHQRSVARATLAYTKANHAPNGCLTEVAGAVATATLQTGHAVLAARGEWVTNEKRLLKWTGLRGVDDILGGLRAESGESVGADAEAELFGFG
ncbi:hypothetical protein [Streptomyces sp. NPDC001975]